MHSQMVNMSGNSMSGMVLSVRSALHANRWGSLLFGLVLMFGLLR